MFLKPFPSVFFRNSMVLQVKGYNVADVDIYIAILLSKESQLPSYLFKIKCVIQPGVNHVIVCFFLFCFTNTNVLYEISKLRFT